MLYAVFVLYGATIPFHFAADHAAVAEKLHQLPLSPFVSPDTGRRLSIPDAVQNVLFFVPFGVLGMLAGNKTMRVSRVALVTVLGALLSLFVEVVQLFEADRVTSVSDLMTNTSGAFAGAALALAGRGAAMSTLRRLQADGLANVRELRPLVVWSVVLAVAAWQPFDVTLELGSVATKVRSLQAGLWQYTGLRDEGLVLLVTALFAMSLAGYLAAIGVPAPARKTAGIGACLVVALESSQILITSRMPSLWDAVVGVAGVTAGAMLGALSRRLQWRSLGLSLLVAATAASAALAMLSPFQFSPEYHTVGWFPLLAYYSRTTFETVSHVIELALLYFPLGYCFAANAPSRRNAGLVAACLAFAIAAPVEALQGWVIGRYPDVSDVALSLAGVWLGVQAARTDS